jgi:hypothetical protein
MKRLLLTLCCTLIVLVIPARVVAWNRAGHMLTGAVAYRILKQSDPQALARVINIFREHPFYEEEWLPVIKALPGNHPDKEGQFLFMYAARWPDDIRGDEDLHCGDCHFVNFRFDPDQPNTASVSIGGELLEAFEENVQVIQSNASNDEKAMALSWIFHLIGDVHQPLHTAALVTASFPQGDRGGTRFFIRASNAGRPLSLHQFWDGLIIGSQRVSTVNNRAIQLLAEPTLQPNVLTELTQTQFSRWADVESFRLAKTEAYLNGALQGGTNEDNAELLPADYAARVKPIAERRAVLAGYRIAKRLREWF